MTWRAEETWRCTECKWLGPASAIKVVQDPDEADNAWSICPECRMAENFDIVCADTECQKIGSCGTPSKDGYKFTCFEHRPTV
jgi:hypothetical protein